MEDHAMLIGVSFDDRILIAMNETVSQHRGGSTIRLTWQSSRRVKRQIESMLGTQEVDDVETFEADEDHVFGRSSEEAVRRLKFIERYMPIFHGDGRETSQR